MVKKKSKEEIRHVPAFAAYLALNWSRLHDRQQQQRMVVNSAMVALCPTMLEGFSAAVYRDSSTEIPHSERFRVRCTLNRSPAVLNTTPMCYGPSYHIVSGQPWHTCSKHILGIATAFLSSLLSVARRNCPKSFILVPNTHATAVWPVLAAQLA